MEAWVSRAYHPHGSAHSELVGTAKHRPKPHNRVVAPRGFEPPTQGLGNLCSIP